MRTILRGFWILSAIGIASNAVGCTAPCGDTHSCGTYVPPEGGSSGASGVGGAAGGANHGGAGGGAGTATGGSGAASGTAGAAGVGGDAAGEGGEAGGGIPCDPTKTPSEESCVVSNDNAVFVAPMGKDGAAGTKSAPVQTIAKAIELAGDTKIVIACDGSYDEQVKLTSGAKLYGGFACPGSATPWSYDSGKRATVAPSARGVALSISSGTSDVVIEDFEFDAKDGVDPGESSVAAFVSTSTNVALTRVKLVAGKGIDAADGSLTPVTFPTQATLKGNSATGDTGGPFNLVMCPAGGTTKGGQGGGGGGAATGGGVGLPALAGGSAGTITSACNAGGGGGDGANAAGQSPASGATKFGGITPRGWSGINGTDGGAGTPGQGGGGGTGAATGGAGGGGGAGGCGGAGGTGGKAGGSSIAVLLLNSTVTLTANELVAGNAGKGGNGVAGQTGQTPGGSAGVQVPDGCGGGKGGKGGDGGSGGGAAGGISAGIAYVGTSAPTPDSETIITTGTAGAKGIGGVPGTNDGIAGVKQDVLQIP